MWVFKSLIIQVVTILSFGSDHNILQNILFLYVYFNSIRQCANMYIVRNSKVFIEGEGGSIWVFPFLWVIMK